VPPTNTQAFLLPFLSPNQKCHSTEGKVAGPEDMAKSFLLVWLDFAAA